MPRFYLHLHQRGEGCDYTIGCGLAIKTLDATSLPEAMAEARAVILEYGSDESAIETATLVEAKQSLGLPVQQWLESEAVEEAEAEAAEAKRKRREEFLRLQAEFG